MTVRMTEALKARLKSDRLDAASFARQFAEWKAGGESTEYSYEMFGKDGAYCSPTINGDKYVLRHVHIRPRRRSQLRIWLKRFGHLSRKTSDRHLVYVESKEHGFLLIEILDEPTAHEVAAMRTPTDKAVMAALAIVAANFVNFGDVP